MTIREIEWTDAFGTHYRVEGRGADGKLYSQTITRRRDGWPSERERVMENVKRAMAANANKNVDKS